LFKFTIRLMNIGIKDELVGIGRFRAPLSGAESAEGPEKDREKFRHAGPAPAVPLPESFPPSSPVFKANLSQFKPEKD